MTGKLGVGEKLSMWSDNEGGNIQINSPHTDGHYYQIDAYNGDLRIYHGDAIGHTADHSIALTTSGVLKVDGRYVNPSMSFNTEYATPFRWNGKVIYVKLITFGALPNGAFKWIGVSGATSIIFASGVDSQGQLIPTNALDMTAGRYYTLNVTGSNNIGVYTSNDRTAYEAWITVMYIK